MRYAILLLVPISLSACNESSSKSPSSPSHAEPIAHETELLKLTLTPTAQKRLGIEIVRVAGGFAQRIREVAGEVVVPPTSANGVPTGSLSNLQQIGAQQATADGEVARTQAQARLARIALNRAQALVREEAGSVRASDEAATALSAAQALADAAQQQRRLLGPAVGALANQATLWVRASVFASDLGALHRGGDATVQPIGDRNGARNVRPIPAPPSANAAVGTVDVYYALDNRDRRFRVGQRVAVNMPITGQVRGLSIPASAVVRDIYGGEWVYRRIAPNTFVRQRVEVASEKNGQTLLARGLESNAEVVSVGTAELFGTEFGAAH